jgi:hypothetical protein
MSLPFVCQDSSLSEKQPYVSKIANANLAYKQRHMNQGAMGGI